MGRWFSKIANLQSLTMGETDFGITEHEVQHVRHMVHINLKKHKKYTDQVTIIGVYMVWRALIYGVVL